MFGFAKAHEGLTETRRHLSLVAPKETAPAHVDTAKLAMGRGETRIETQADAIVAYSSALTQTADVLKAAPTA